MFLETNKQQQIMRQGEFRWREKNLSENYGHTETVAAMLSLIGVVTGEGFLRKMVLANIFIGKKTATSIGEFFQTFGNLIASTPELTDNKLKAIRAYQTLISGIIADGVATNIWITSLILGKNTGTSF